MRTCQLSAPDPVLLVLVLQGEVTTGPRLVRPGASPHPEVLVRSPVFCSVFRPAPSVREETFPFLTLCACALWRCEVTALVSTSLARFWFGASPAPLSDFDPGGSAGPGPDETLGSGSGGPVVQRVRWTGLGSDQNLFLVFGSFLRAGCAFLRGAACVSCRARSAADQFNVINEVIDHCEARAGTCGSARSSSVRFGHVSLLLSPLQQAARTSSSSSSLLLLSSSCGILNGAVHAG